ncbi:MAG: hypothetical protein ABI663_03440 [Chryseolinea sp.]
MKVKCIYNTGKAYENYRMPVGYSSSSQFGVEIGKEYLVMGMSLWEGSLAYLIDDGIPHLYPFQLFQIVDSRLFVDWHFRTFGVESQMGAIWGYYELCYSDGYYENLIEGEDSAVQLYYKKKIEFEKTYLTE